jgi:hypothetical protein
LLRFHTRELELLGEGKWRLKGVRLQQLQV